MKGIIDKEDIMIAIFLKHKYLAGAIIGLLSLSIICQIIMGVLFHIMIRESGNMPATKNKSLKKCKLKYINCYKLNGRMVNTSVFVDKFIQKITFLKIPLIRFSHISGQLMMLSVLVTGITICFTLAAGDTLFQIIPYYLSSILGLYLYFSISGLVDIQGKKKILKTNLVDYLENHLVPRLEVERENLLRGEKAQDREDEMSPERTMGWKEGLRVKEDMEKAVPASADYQDELEDLLKEFFA